MNYQLRTKYNHVILGILIGLYIPLFSVGNVPCKEKASLKYKLVAQKSSVISGIEIDFNIVNPNCSGSSSGQILIEITKGLPPFQVSWKHLKEELNGKFNVASLDSLFSIDALPSGQVSIIIKDYQANVEEITIEIKDPPPIIMSPVKSNYNGYNISCNGGKDGTIDLQISGGKEPYQIEWASGEKGKSLQNLAVGIYSFSLTDNLNCKKTATVVMTEPQHLEFDMIVLDENCEGDQINGGSVQFAEINGGVSPYSFALANNQYKINPTFNNISPGSFRAYVKDNNGCIKQKEVKIDSATIPKLSGTTLYQVELGSSINLDLEVDEGNIKEIQWSNAVGLSCSDCLQPEWKPLFSERKLLKVRSENGCFASISIGVEVQKLRNYYVPTAFSPNNDTRNERFGIFGSAEMAHYDLDVYDRYGNRVYSKKRLRQNDKRTWDGTFGNLQLQSGIYIWKANIHFIDGESIVRFGEVNLLK